MTNFKNTKMAKVISGFVGISTAVMMMGPAVASAATVEELTAQINALLAQVSALQAAQTSSSAMMTSGHVYNVDLTIGSKGDDVVALQTLLVSKGFLTMPAGVAMGYFGGLTKAAVSAWQASAGITPTAGYVGPKSRAALNAMVAMTPTTPTTTTPTTPVVTGTGVSAMLDATSPAAHTIIAGQSVATLAIFKITNAGAAAAKVTSLKFKRTGVSSDTTVSNVYLYNGAARITDAASVATGVISFNDSTGVVTVPAGSSVSVTVRADIATGTNGQTLGVMLTDVVSDGGTTSGLPVSGAESTIASAPSDMMTANYTTAAATPSAASIDPQNDYTVWQENLTINSHDGQIASARFRQIGPVNTNDLQNFRFYVDGVQVGSTVTNLDSNGYVTFTFATPVTVKTGTRVLKLVADIIGGSNRNFQFSLRQAGDMEIVDGQLNVSVLPTVNSATFSAINAGIQTVNQGTLTITKATDSPSGNVVLTGSSVTLAKFDVKAQGERLKVENLRISHTASDASWTGIRNGAVFLNGAQIGSTATVNEVSQATPYTQFNLGSSMILEPGVNYVLEVRGDVYNTNTATASGLSAGTTTVVNIAAGSSNVQRLTSLSYFNNGTASGSTLTVAAGSVSVAKYGAYANQTVVVPQTAYKIGEYRITTGSTEGVNLDTFTVALNGDVNGTAGITAGYVTNLYIVYGSKTSTTKATGAATQTFSLNEVVPVNSTLNFAVYGTLSAAMTGVASTTLVVSGTSASSGNAVSSGTAITGQEITIGSGSIVSAQDASTPGIANVVGNSQPKIASFKFTSSNDAFTITELTAKVASTDAAAVYKNVIFKDGATTIATQPFNGAYATSSGLTISVPYNSVKVIDAYADLGSIGTGYATSGAAITLTLDGFEYQNSNGVKTRDYSDVAGKATYAYKTKPTITNVALPSTLLTTGVQTVAKFSIASDVGGTIAWRKIVLTIATSTPSGSLFVTGYNLYADSDQSTPLTNTTGTLLVNSSTSTITFTSTSDQEVSGSKTYVVKANVSGSPAATANVSHNMVVGSGIVHQAPTTAAIVEASAANFVWSDESVNPHTALTSDWNNEYLVKNIPTDSQVLTK